MNIEHYICLHGRIPDDVLILAKATFKALGVKYPVGTKASLGNARRTYWWQRRKPKLWCRASRREVVFDRGQLIDMVNGIKLWQPWWFAMICHELFHVYQYDRAGPWKWRLIQAGNTLMTIVTFGYSHKRIPIEVEATAFSDKCVDYWNQRQHTLLRFKYGTEEAS